MQPCVPDGMHRGEMAGPSSGDVTAGGVHSGGGGGCRQVGQDDDAALSVRGHVYQTMKEWSAEVWKAEPAPPQPQQRSPRAHILALFVSAGVCCGGRCPVSAVPEECLAPHLGLV